MNINNYVSLAKEKMSIIPTNEIPKRYRCGGRCGTAFITLYDFAKRFGNPHAQTPGAWYDYESEGIYGAGKITALWSIATPRGPAEISDYWWNQHNQLSIRCDDIRAVKWVLKWLRAHGIDCCLGSGK